MTSGTNWDAISHPTLHNWFTTGSSESVANSVQTWQQGIGTQFDKVSHLIDGALRDTDAVWEGGAAEAMKSGVSPLAQFARDAKDVSTKVGEGAAELARSYDDIKAKMPAPVQVTTTDNALERGLSHLFGMKTDKERQEESARQAEDRARDLAKAYDSNVTTTMAGLPVFVPAPIVATDVGGSGGGARSTTTGITSAQTMVSSLRPGVEYNPISPAGASTSTTAAGAGPAGTPSGPVGPNSGNPGQSGGRLSVPTPPPSTPTNGPGPNTGRTAGGVNPPKPPSTGTAGTTPPNPAGGSRPTGGRITSILNPGLTPSGPETRTSAPRPLSGPPSSGPGAPGARPPAVGAPGTRPPAVGGSGGPGGGPGAPRGGAGLATGGGPGAGGGAPAAGAGPRGPLGPGGMSGAAVAPSGPVPPPPAMGPAGGRGPAGVGGMAPMAGAAGGRREEDKERHSNYLQETDDIWGSGEQVAPSVIGDLDTRP
ncbi:PPE family [Streptoalloteichus tenebrarius]|uniref:PPE family n=1 Tax=Streptoalloteichus tenebrarius (strain ATCC 17920 / DSM 40477 / JCM 4838 / CBS 697.72 / NBRC 16177 / NCIMB 11028 / NRRL B-12390 / A12253. 1 / ISP 5477) TaxID=1933 RepID=A0ABT1HUY9_STRSD|nr:hypothetical protein [Streptoalloteichus tenebrarius]MCP2259336.1 PPE family [Streptoalloteichus tenebrarius]